jgi:DNA anti-recombination protein RmuC
MRPTPEIGTSIAPREKNAVVGTLNQHSTMPNDDDRPATKQDLNDLRIELHGDMDHLRNELRGGMAALRTELNGNMDQLRTELNGNMDQLRTELNGNMSRLREELVEQMRDMQTEVLRAFHGWASPIEIRLRALPNMEERLVLLEERVSGIERREKRT